MKWIAFLVLLLLVIGGAFYWFKFARQPKIHLVGNAYRFDFKNIDGGDLPLSQYQGKAVLLVNTASQCGFTPQYEGLEKLWQTYRNQGLVVLGVPSNDFGNQEPGSEKDIKQFCELNFNVDFPMAAKVHTRGAQAHPFYAWIWKETGTGPRWNFHKYLIAPDGEVVRSFPSAVKPMSKTLQGAIGKVLPVPAQK